MTPARVSVDHRIMDGVLCISGTRIPVATVVGLVADGLAAEDVVEQYPQLERDDVLAALAYAARAIDERHLPFRTTA
ncbi:DUF433 domain-containing protein [Iamia sp.]|uniref:DUF433 domain-containing protein n=1 Tax=Iamia sp. TaxID=2722710 RepID=UPI002D01FD30|nr:DUF433 domain-containing protein [Iamia sp.]HXH58887.1 DUF433 domain-containing protein [Iamia sp.]